MVIRLGRLTFSEAADMDIRSATLVNLPVQ
jgi:hypothetical protein